MKKLVLRIVSIAAAFLLGVLGMGYYLMAGNTDSTAHMASATLPLIYLEQGGRSFNLMHGYTKSMDASSIRTRSCRFRRTGKYPFGSKARIRLSRTFAMRSEALTWTA